MNLWLWWLVIVAGIFCVVVVAAVIERKKGDWKLEGERLQWRRSSR
jgi:hypothetical protein